VLDRSSRMMVLATVVAAILAVGAGCGDDDDGDTAEETTTTEAVTTAPVEDTVQQAVDDAVSTCTQIAIADIESEPLRRTATTGCEEVGRSLNQEVAALSESAREDVDAALKELSAKCRNLVADLPEPAKPTLLEACDQLAAGG
jgi:hypothetical protein